VWASAVALAGPAAAYAANGFVEIDAAALPGLYRVDWPAAALAAGADRTLLAVAPQAAAFAPSTILAELVDATILPGQSQVLLGVAFGDPASPLSGTLTPTAAAAGGRRWI
jgi:hypothetical protein